MPTTSPVRAPRAPRSHWKLRSPADGLARDIARRHALSPVVAALLAARGWNDPDALERHLVPRQTDLFDPFGLPDMRAATARLRTAIERGQTILVHGDYDVDGVTGTALLVRLLRELGADAQWHIPNRFTDGYSFGAHSVEQAQRVGASVVVSVDNGTSAGDVIAELARHGIDTIVTDHHEPPRGALPDAVAIVNPKLEDSTYPFRELCGAAVAFKLAWGLCQEITGTERVSDELRTFLVDAMAYVAIATVCDVVPLIGENRIFAGYGLRSLGASQNPGLAALRDVAGLASDRPLDAEDVAFQIGPRINASGRLGSAHRAVELLLATDADHARSLARELDEMNVERRRIERELLDEAVAAAEPYADARQHPVLVIAGEGWHQGVVGIVAARLSERFARPALVIGLDKGHGRGSARSVPGVSVLELLHAGAQHVDRYGGHEQAAGCEVRADNVDALREAMRARALELYAEGMPEAPLWLDCEIPFGACNDLLMRELDRLRPFGEQNEKAVFLSRDLRLAEPPRVVGKTGDHMILVLRDGPHALRGIAFGQASRDVELGMGRALDVVYSPRWNTFRGETKLELLVRDFRTGPRPFARPFAQPGARA